MATQPQQFDPRGLLASGSRVILVVSSGPPTTQAPLVEMPDILGAKQGDALVALQEAGLSAQVFNDYSDSYKRGDVMGQLPPSGAGVPRGADAVMLVSSGPAISHTKSEMLPEVVGKPEAEAVSILQAASFSPQVVREPSMAVLAGTVIAQLPNRATLAEVPAKKNAWLPWVITAAVLLVVGLLAFFLLRPGGTVEVPDVIGKTEAEAVEILEEAGLDADVKQEEVEGEEGTVVAENPAPGTTVEKNTKVEVTVVKPRQQVAVPNVVGLDQAEATKRIQAAGLAVSTSRASSLSVPQGRVISQNPAAAQQVNPGSRVALVISSGPEQTNVKVPDVEGMTKADAQSELSGAGLKVIVAENASDDVAKGIVISQLPKAGDSVAPGTSVGIVVSTGPAANPDEVTVPDVVGLSLAEAQQVVTDASLQALPVPYDGSGKPANEVVAQTPVGGDKIQKDSTIVLYYSTGP